jgi:hypothetical protein
VFTQILNPFGIFADATRLKRKHTSGKITNKFAAKKNFCFSKRGTFWRFFPRPTRGNSEHKTHSSRTGETNSLPEFGSKVPPDERVQVGVQCDRSSFSSSLLSAVRSPSVNSASRERVLRIAFCQQHGHVLPTHEPYNFAASQF